MIKEEAKFASHGNAWNELNLNYNDLAFGWHIL